MKIFYLSRAKIPNTKAHVLQIHKMCDAFQQAGASVELYHPWSPDTELKPESLKEDYNLSQPLNYVTVPCLNIRWLRQKTERLGFLIYAATYCLIGLFWLLYRYAKSRDTAVIYSRDRLFSYLLLFLKPLISFPIFLELHEIPESFNRSLTAGLTRRADGIVVISNALKEELVDAGFESSSILVQPDAADKNNFEISSSPDSLRKELQLPLDRPLVGFTGNLYSYNGPDVLMELAKQAPDLFFVVVGGSDKHLTEYRQEINRREIENLHLEGYQPHRQIPRYLKAFDVLLLPLQPEINRTLKYCSPLKLFEYLMAGRPIVASDLPSLREVLTDGDNALLVNPGEARNYLQAIRRILNNDDLKEKLASNALKTSRNYSWESRAGKIIEYMRSSLPEPESPNV